MHVATRMFDTILSKNEQSLLGELKYSQDGLGRERAKVRLAALLHDIGHAPFSHAGEASGLMPNQPDDMPYAHEDYSASIVSRMMKDVIDGHPYNKTNYHITTEEIAEFLRGDASAGTSLMWRPLISGQVDADRSDYLLRDSIHCGVEYGRFDLQRILVTLTLALDRNENRVIAVEEGGWHAAEGLILARYMMFTQVYFHAVRRSYDHHIAEVMRELLGRAQRGTRLDNKSSFPPPNSKTNVDRFLKWDDWRVLGMIQAGRAGEHGEIIRRRLHDRFVHETQEVPDEEDLERLETIVSALGSMVSHVDDASKSWYSFGEEDLMVRPASTEVGIPLSNYSSVVRGLYPVSQRRVYVRYSDKIKAEELIRSI